MTALIILAIALIVLVALALADVPVALALLAAGGLGLIMLRNDGYAFNTLANQPFSTSSSFALTLIPMFIIMGMFVVQAGIASDVYVFAARVFGRFRGGLGYATVAATAGFSAVTGSSAATVATIGRISIHEMRKHGYSPGFAASIVAASGTLGILIPPSIVLVIYGTLSGESIGELLVAGIIPGILSAFMYGLVVWWRAKSSIGDEHRIDEHADTVEPAADERTLPVRVNTRRQVIAIIEIAVLFLIVIGGIYSGVFTATESGAIAAGAALVILVLTALFRADVNLRASLTSALRDTTSISSMIFLLLIGGGVFAFFIASGGYARDLAVWVTGLGVPPTLIVIALLLIILPLGMVLDSLAILLITVPLIHPIVTELGFEGIWFAILMVKMVEIGLLTPPVGLNVFVVAGSSPGIRVEDVFRSIWPFVIAEFTVIAILFAAPDLVTWLPSHVS